MTDTPPPEVARAAELVRNYLDSRPGVVRSAQEIAAMSPRERINYCRQFDQKSLPDWKDPRT